jgi:5'-3' exonuclease
MLQNMLVATKAKKCIIYLTGEGNFRDKVAVTLPYKGNRADREKPAHMEHLKRKFLEDFKAIIVNGAEADDGLGIAQTGFRERDKESVICSIDKDLLMIPGKHYNFDKGEFYDIDEETGQRMFYKQMLTGDSTDNIAGIPKVGPVAADYILSGMSVDEAIKASRMRKNKPEVKKMPIETVRKYVQQAYKAAFMSDAKNRIVENQALLNILKKPKSFLSFKDIIKLVSVEDLPLPMNDNKGAADEFA